MKESSTSSVHRRHVKKSGDLPRQGVRIAVFVAGLLLVTQIALARAGGGEGYGGGGGHGGGGGGGDGGSGFIFYLIYWLLRLCISYPIIGIPVVIGVVIFFIYAGSSAGNKGAEAYQSSVIRRGTRVMGDQQKASAVARIREHDPNFDEAYFCQRVQNAFVKTQAAWCAQDMNVVRPFVSDGVFERFSLQFEEQRQDGYHDVMEGLAVDEAAVADVVVSGVFDEMTVRIAARAADYRVTPDGKRLGGSTAVQPFVEYWSFLRRRDAVTGAARSGLLEGNCPNCGASLEMNASADCPNCKAILQSGQYDWVLTEITQESEWHPNSRQAIPGLDQLRKQDEGFDRQALEDRASVIFWRKAAADRVGKIEFLRKVASEEFCARYAPSLAPVDGARRTFMGECAVGGVEMTAFIPAAETSEMERALVSVRWSAQRMDRDGDGPPRATGGHILARSVLVLGRAARSVTDAARSISSAHCPNCGAPQSNQTDNACNYCGAVLNDGRHGWVLQDWLTEGDPAVSELLRAARAGTGTSPGESSDIDVPWKNTASRDGGVAPPRLPAAAITGGGLGMVAWAVKVAASDGSIEPRERKVLAAFAANRGVSTEQLDQLCNAAFQGDLQVPQPNGPDEAREWLRAMAAIAVADGKITRDETALLMSMAVQTGIDNNQLQQLLRQVRSEAYTAASDALRAAKAGRPS